MKNGKKNAKRSMILLCSLGLWFSALQIALSDPITGSAADKGGQPANTKSDGNATQVNKVYAKNEDEVWQEDKVYRLFDTAFTDGVAIKAELTTTPKPPYFEWILTPPTGSGATIDSPGDLITSLTDIDVPGIYKLQARCSTADEGKTLSIIILKVDLKMDVNDDGDIDEDDETLEDTTGAIVFENWDNDDNDADFTPDKTENTVSGEDDLVEINLDVQPADMTSGVVKLECNNAKLKIWKAATKNNQFVSLPATWDLATATVPSSLYVEGYDKSVSKNDITLTLNYTPNGASSAVGSDQIHITVVRQNLGVACYRELKSKLLPDLNHAGLVAEYTGNRTKSGLDDNTKWNVIQMPGVGSGANKITLTAYMGSNLAFHGYYSVSDLNDETRNKVIRYALDILDATTISYTWTDALSWDGLSWDGTIADIRQLRCDGVVEVSYELSGRDVWGKNSTHYPIQNYPGEHNNLGKDNPQTELSPIVQRGGVSGSPTKLSTKERYEPKL